MGVVVIVDVIKIVVVEGYHEASKSSLTCDVQKTSPSGVAGPPLCSPSGGSKQERVERAR